jgi:hypothetical protein
MLILTETCAGTGSYYTFLREYAQYPKQETGYRLSGMSSQDSCWHLRWLKTELTLTGERSAVNVARSVRRGLAGKAGNAARWLATLQITLFHYLQAKILADDPFQVLDQDGVGELVEMGVIRGRQTKPGLKIGICGEHGGEPKSIAFCHRLEMDYVSCSPFRVPIARLAAAQAMIGRTIRELIS